MDFHGNVLVYPFLIVVRKDSPFRFSSMTMLWRCVASQFGKATRRRGLGVRFQIWVLLT
jgi:hypothetical protein